MNSLNDNKVVLPDKLVELFHKHGDLKKYTTGEIIFAAGDSSDFVYLIEEGVIRICHFAKNGTSITLLTHEAGELIGIGGAIDNKERAVYAVASKDGCKVWRIPSKEYVKLLEENTELSYYTAIFLARRLRVLDTQILRQISIRAHDRLAVVLFDMSVKNPLKVNDEIAVKITQQELSDILGTCRQTTTSMIGKLKDEGVVDTKKGYIVIKDWEELQKRALQIES